MQGDDGRNLCAASPAATTANAGPPSPTQMEAAAQGALRAAQHPAVTPEPRWHSCREVPPVACRGTGCATLPACTGTALEDAADAGAGTGSGHAEEGAAAAAAAVQPRLPESESASRACVAVTGVTHNADPLGCTGSIQVGTIT